MAEGLPKKRRGCLFWLCLLGFLTAPLCPAAPQFIVDPPWTIEQGLPQHSVLSLARTRDGYLWLGTLGGLVRFDGLRFVVFDESNTPGLNSSRIVQVFEDSRTNLWVGTETAGLVLIKPGGKVTGIDLGRGSREGRVLSICEDKNGAVWFYTAGGQLARYQGTQFDVWNAGSEQPSSVRTMVAEDSGLLWVGTDFTLTGLGPLSPDSGTGLPASYQIPITRKLDLLAPSKKGGYWRLADQRIQKRKQNAVVRDLGPYPWKGNVPITAACEDAEGNLVVGTYGDGIYWFSEDGTATHILSELSHTYVFSLLFDAEGSLWVGTDGGGLIRIRPKLFQVLPGSGSFTVQSAAQDREGTVWFGINGGGVGRTTRSGDTRQFTSLASLYVRSVLVDKNQQIWAGTFGGGLYRFSGETFERAPGSTVLDPHLPALYEDASGEILAGTQNGLARWDGASWKVLTNDFQGKAIQAIAGDGEGGLWIGTDSAGLHHIRDGKTIAVFSRTNGLLSDNVYSLWLDRDHVLWVGTGGGLARLKSAAWKHFTAADGLVSNHIGYLVEDDQGFLWMGSNAGIMRIRKKELIEFAEGRAASFFCHVYGKSDGLIAGECTQGSQPSVCRASDGTFWFPTIRGLVGVKPAAILPDTNIPPVVIEAVLVDNQPQNSLAVRAAPPHEITISPGKESLDIRFTSLNLTAPQKCRFKYRLAGHESAWHYQDGIYRTAHYSRVPPGDYTFEVTAENQDGLWNPQGATLAVNVLPPFWRKWWFLALVAGTLLALVVAIVHYISTQRLQRQLALLRQQEALEKERARIARDIHDQVGASLTQVSLLAELIESDKEDPNEIEGHARQISQTTLETTRALDEIVWTVNPSNDTLDGLINYVCKYAQEYLAVAGLRYRLEVPADLPNTPISPELRHNVFLAAKEAVTNVVRHAHASAAVLRLRLEPGRFTLEIEDNGRGLGKMDPTAAAARNGLKNMRKRMEDVGGSFDFVEVSGGGALVRLTAPIHNKALA